MKKLLTLTLLLAALGIAAVQYQVLCPQCNMSHTLEATGVLPIGSYATNIGGVEGNMIQQRASFHCPHCHTNFAMPMKPDKFEPNRYAVPARSEVVTNPPPGSVATNQPPSPLSPMLQLTQDPITYGPERPWGTWGKLLKVAGTPTNYWPRLIQTVQLPDGSELLIYHKPAK